MGEVYRARDLKLHREVALKVLPETVAAQPERVARFEREAQLLASLNHPHIAQIYGVEDTQGVRALVMELVPGKTLSEFLVGRTDLQSAERIADSLSIARQIADALEAAHERGIIHRDLKPGNVMITPDGQVKLLDFGLGKSIDRESSADISNSPTLTAGATEMGIILGTAAYMAPEQAKGRTIDKRCDIWAFGCVLYEMLTGKRAFEGEDVSDTLANILKTDVDWRALPAAVPAHIRRLLERCLQKDRKLRLRDIGDVLLELNESVATIVALAPAPPPTPRSSGRWGERAAWLAAMIAVAAAAGGVMWRVRAPAPELENRVDINTPDSREVSIALSPDGRKIVYGALSTNGQSMLWLRGLDSTVARPIPGTESAVVPFWAPDGRSIGFFSGAKLKRVDLGGGSPQNIAEATAARGASWSESDVILFTPNTGSGLYRIPATGGTPELAIGLMPETSSLRFPQFLPDGRHFIFFAQGSAAARGVYLGSLDSREAKRLIDADAAGQFLAPDWVLFVSQGALLARRLDLARERLSDDSVIVADTINYDAASYASALSTSATDTFVYRAGGAGRRQLTWFDRTGKVLGTLGEADDSRLSPSLSHDGKRAAVLRTVQGNTDVWIIDADRSTRLTFDTGMDQFPIFSPDDKQVIFRSNRRQGMFDLYTKSADGAGAEQQVMKGFDFLGAPNDWTRNGDYVLLTVSSPKTGYDIWVLPMTGERKPYPFLNSGAEERNVRLSRDGRWVAYQSSETGRPEIYVRPFPGPGGQWQVSTGGGIQPAWKADGSEIYFIAADAKMMSVSISTKGDSVQSGAPSVLFQTRIVGSGYDTYSREQYDVASDGRFLINTILGDVATPPITLVQHWQPKK